jgi:hypothetical protein
LAGFGGSSSGGNEQDRFAWGGDAHAFQTDAQGNDGITK